MLFELGDLHIQYTPGSIRYLAMNVAWALCALRYVIEDADLPLAVQHLAHQVEAAI
jgi:hypothetical protein